MRTALLLLATGEKYQQYVEPLLESARKFFVPHDALIWTDNRQIGKAFYKQGLGYPNETLYRYHTFLTQEGLLRSYDYLFYSDIDMRFVAPVIEEEIFSDGITATLHPGFAHERIDKKSGDFVPTCGTPERANPISTAYIAKGTDNKYFCGGFNGGTSETYLRMARVIKKNIDIDKENFGMGYSAKWHDESHLNRYLYDNQPAKILTPSFCYPEDYDGGYGWTPNTYEPKLIALDKGKKR